MFLCFSVSLFLCFFCRWRCGTAFECRDGGVYRGRVGLRTGTLTNFVYGLKNFCSVLKFVPQYSCVQKRADRAAALCISFKQLNSHPDSSYYVPFYQQVFGELAVLDSDTLSPVSAISSTAVEIYCFDINTMSEVQW